MPLQFWISLTAANNSNQWPTLPRAPVINDNMSKATSSASNTSVWLID
jgi:hypothetical protein